YCDPLSLLLWNCGIACSSNDGILTVRPVVYVTTKSFTYGYATYNTITNTIIVAFRGTDGIPSDITFRTLESFLNWETNLEFTMIDYNGVPNTKVHIGFYHAYDAIKTQVRSSVYALVQTFPQATVLVTGHSLGGALATLAAIDLKQQYEAAIIQLYTFGSPRVGNAAFVDYMYTFFPQGSIYRIVHSNDIVPQVPTFMENYVHVGIEIWYPNNDLTYRQCLLAPPVYEDPTCSFSQVLNLDIAAHMLYLGYSITNLCPIECPLSECTGCPVNLEKMNDGDLGAATKTNTVLARRTRKLRIQHLLYNNVLLRKGLLMDGICPGHCDGSGCDEVTGICKGGCSNSNLWWGQLCDQPCLGHCDGMGCRKDNGLCAGRCSDNTKWWSDQCDKHCGGHCDGSGCNKATGFCNGGCSDKAIWWELKCCNNPCIGHCDGSGCSQSTGYCNGGCADNTQWWGKAHCDQHCIGHCDGQGCKQTTGFCNGGCSDNTRWWGDEHCDRECVGHCDGQGCNQHTGYCNAGCNGKWWGLNCDNSCAQCDDFGCNKETGACNHIPAPTSAI
ncbi:unnamed protein product, partial [Didymodactylos carnosus]